MSDTIKKHAKKLLTPFKHSPNAEQVITSAKNLASMILNSNDILEKHKNIILSEVIWYISEVDGKHTTRYRSKTVVDLAENNPNSQTKIIHEHVYTRKSLREEMKKNPSQFSLVLDKVTSCVVTIDEHKKLDDTEIGWERYKSAGIEVFDMSATPPCLVEFAKLAQ